MERKITRREPITLNLPKRKRVAAYARVSSGKDAMLHSLSAQVSYYSELIQNHRGWEYIGVYADEALTGTKDNRAEFQRLLADCRKGLIDMVITKSISRFARNTVTMLETVRELKELNVDIYFEKENIHSTSGDGELMLTILASFAQEESLSVSENCKWRIRKRFANGELVSLRFIYGYHINKGKVEINPQLAAIIRMVFDDYINGMGCTLIAKKLRDMGIERPRGGVWDSERVADIINNEKYAGNALLQKKYVADHLTKSLKWNKDKLPKYYADNTHPPIIDTDTFHKAQVIMASNREKYAGKKANGHYPFTSKIVCGICGKHYTRKVKDGRISWNCSTYFKYGKDTCPARQIPEYALHASAAKVLGLDVFDEMLFEQQIKELKVLPDNKLSFDFHDGHTEQSEWVYKSRSESWNDKRRKQTERRVTNANCV